MGQRQNLAKQLEPIRDTVTGLLHQLTGGASPRLASGLRWRSPEVLAAALNGSLFVLVPSLFAAYADYTLDAVRPYQPTVWSSALRALPIAMVLLPVSVVVAWRTFVNARRYRRDPFTVWRGPVESAALAGVIALTILVRATAATWAREPSYLVLAYIAFYVVATALVGLALGVALAATALAAIHIGRWAFRSAERRSPST